MHLCDLAVQRLFIEGLKRTGVNFSSPAIAELNKINGKSLSHLKTRQTLKE